MRLIVVYLVSLFGLFFFSLPIPYFFGVLLTGGLLALAPTAAYYMVAIFPAVLLNEFGFTRWVTVPLAIAGFTIFAIAPNYFMTKWVENEDRTQVAQWVNQPLERKPRSLGIFSQSVEKNADVDFMLTASPCTELCQKILYGRTVDWVGRWNNRNWITKRDNDYSAAVKYSYSEIPVCPKFLAGNNQPIAATANHIIHGQCITSEILTNQVADTLYKRTEENFSSPFPFIAAGNRTAFDFMNIDSGVPKIVVHRTMSTYHIPKRFPILGYTWHEDIPTDLMFSADKVVLNETTEERLISEVTGIKFADEENKAKLDSRDIVVQLLDQSSGEPFGNERIAFVEQYLRDLREKKQWTEEDRAVVTRLVNDKRVVDNRWVSIAIENQSDIVAATVPAILQKLKLQTPRNTYWGLQDLARILSKLDKSKLEPFAAEIRKMVEEQTSNQYAPLMEAIGAMDEDYVELQQKNLLKNNPKDERWIEATIAGICRGTKVHADALTGALVDLGTRQMQHLTIEDEYVGAIMVILKKAGHETEFKQLKELLPSNVSTVRLQLEPMKGGRRLRCLDEVVW